MGKGITRRRYGRSHPRPGPRTRTLHPPRRTIWENPSSQPGRNLARKYKTAQNFRNWWLRITGTHKWNPYAERLSQATTLLETVVLRLTCWSHARDWLAQPTDCRDARR